MVPVQMGGQGEVYVGDGVADLRQNVGETEDWLVRRDDRPQRRGKLRQHSAMDVVAHRGIDEEARRAAGELHRIRFGQIYGGGNGFRCGNWEFVGADEDLPQSGRRGASDS